MQVTEHLSSGLATAHQNWDERWNDAAVRAGWEQPDNLVQALVPRMRQRGLKRVLDLGCGIGRHAQYMAAQGFVSVGVDASHSALSHAHERAAAAGLSIDYRLGTFYEPGLADGSFDVVIAWNVLYHGDGEIAGRAIDGIRRVLVPGGLYVGSMLSKRNAGYGRGREVRPGTFVVDDDPGDKVHPHFYCDGQTLVGLHRAFEILDLRDHEQTPGAYHWEFTMERR
jgi:2-polyprenyl-3-methyl-5-hydroxy-6-metoxy-1,4-benzoquinol methylase